MGAPTDSQWQGMRVRTGRNTMTNYHENLVQAEATVEVDMAAGRLYACKRSGGVPWPTATRFQRVADEWNLRWQWRYIEKAPFPT